MITIIGACHGRTIRHPTFGNFPEAWIQDAKHHTETPRMSVSFKNICQHLLAMVCSANVWYFSYIFQITAKLHALDVSHFITYGQFVI